MKIDTRQRGVEDCAADIIKKDVNAVGASAIQRFAKILALVVYGTVEAESISEEGTFISSTGNANSATT